MGDTAALTLENSLFPVGTRGSQTGPEMERVVAGEGRFRRHVGGRQPWASGPAGSCPDV